MASGSFERVCVLFNVAAMQSQIAETQNIGSDDGRKLATKLFQVFIAAVLTEQLIVSWEMVTVIYLMYGISASVCYYGSVLFIVSVNLCNFSCGDKPILVAK